MFPTANYNRFDCYKLSIKIIHNKGGENLTAIEIYIFLRVKKANKKMENK